MNQPKFSLKIELTKLRKSIYELDKKAVTIFLLVGILQTISWYFSSRKFFRATFFDDLQFHPHVYLIEYFYWFIGDFVVFFLIPVLFIKFWFKEKISGYGLKAGDYRAGFKIVILFLAVMLPLVWVFSAQQNFSDTYPHLNAARSSWNIFFLYETGMFIYMISWEFIWRGFMLFGLKEKFGNYAVLIQMLPFLVLHNGKPFAETFGSIFAGIALGILALRTGSIFYCIITHSIVMLSIDFISTLRYRTSSYGIGPDALQNILKEIF